MEGRHDEGEGGRPEAEEGDGAVRGVVAGMGQAEGAREPPVLGQGVQGPGAGIERAERAGEVAEGDPDRAGGAEGPDVDRAGEGVEGRLELVEGDGVLAGETDQEVGHDEVEEPDRDDAAEDGPRDRLLGLLRLVAEGRRALEARHGEEAEDEAAAEGREAGAPQLQLGPVDPGAVAGHRDPDDRDHDREGDQLDHDHDVARELHVPVGGPPGDGDDEQRDGALEGEGVGPAGPLGKDEAAVVGRGGRGAADPEEHRDDVQPAGHGAPGGPKPQAHEAVGAAGRGVALGKDVDVDEDQQADPEDGEEQEPAAVAGLAAASEHDHRT